MKRVLKCIVVGVVLLAALCVVGALLEYDLEDFFYGAVCIVILVAGWGFRGYIKSKRRDRFAELREKHGKNVLGFIQKPVRLQNQLFILMIVLSAFIVGLAAIFVFACMDEGYVDMEVLFYLVIGWIALGLGVAACRVGIKKFGQETVYGEDFVMVYYGKDEKMLQWSDFGSCKKFGAQMRFYDRNGNKLFEEDTTVEGYEDFWKLYQKHVQGKSDEEIAAEKFAK